MGTELETKANTGRRYDLPQVLQGLAALAYNNGNATKAAKELKKAQPSLPVSPRTLRKWKNDLHKEDYERVRREILPIVGADVADAHMELAREQLNASRVLTREALAQRAQLEPKDRVNLIGKMDIGSGIHTEKARDLAGDFETPIAPSRDASSVLRSLMAKGVFIDADAEEIPSNPQLSPANGTDLPPAAD